MAAVVLGFLALGDLVQAQTVVYRGVAFTGKKFAGLRSMENLGSFGPPVINDRGEVFYRAVVYGNGIDDFRNDRVIRQVRRRPLTVAQELQILTPAQALSGIADRSLYKGALQANPPPDDAIPETVVVALDYAFNADGDLVDGPNITHQFDDFLAVDREGRVAFANGLLIQGTITYQTPPSDPADPPETNTDDFDDNFDVLFLSTRSGASYVGMVAENENYDPNRFTQFNVPFGLYSGGRASITGSSAGANDVFIIGGGSVSGLYFGSFFDMQLLGRVGGSAAGLPINASYSSFSLPGVNSGGVVSTNTQVNSDPSIFNGIYNFGLENRPGFFLGTGTVAPGTEGTFGEITSSPWLSMRGNLAFAANIVGDDAISSGVFVGRVRNDEKNLAGGAVQLLVAAGSASLAPLNGRFNNAAGESPDAVFASFEQPGVNNRGTVAFLATVTGTNIDAANDTGLWVVPSGTDNATRAAKLIVRTGDLIHVDGVQKEVASVGFNPYYGLNNRNEVVFSVSFADATSGVIRAIIR